MSPIMQLISPLRYCLLLALVLAPRACRHKTLEELLSVAPDDPGTVEVLIVSSWEG